MSQNNPRDDSPLVYFIVLIPIHLYEVLILYLFVSFGYLFTSIFNINSNLSLFLVNLILVLSLFISYKIKINNKLKKLKYIGSISVISFLIISLPSMLGLKYPPFFVISFLFFLFPGYLIWFEIIKPSLKEHKSSDNAHNKLIGTSVLYFFDTYLVFLFVFSSVLLFNRFL